MKDTVATAPEGSVMRTRGVQKMNVWYKGEDGQWHDGVSQVPDLYYLLPSSLVK